MNISEAIIKNMLSVLYSKNYVEPVEIDLLKKTVAELGISKQDFSIYFSQWKEKHDDLLYGKTLQDNLNIFSYMILSAYFNQIVVPEENKVLEKYCSMNHMDISKLKNFISSSPKFDFSAKISPNLKIIITYFSHDKNISINFNKTTIKDPALYVASQITKEGIDELQALCLCGKLGLNAALSGPPGVGKTQSVLEAARILEKPVFSKTCSSRTTENHIISHPTLIEQNGVTITAHENGPLCQAMETPGIFYGDEYNLLKEDVQKRMNSAFDDRRYIDRNDGFQVKAQPDFLPIISYNPGQSLTRRDLEESVADRFIHFHFGEWYSDFKAYVSMKTSYKKMNLSTLSFSDFNIELETRGICSDGHFVILSNDDKTWLNFFTGDPVSADPHYIYHAHKIKNLNRFDNGTRESISNLSDSSYTETELPRIFSRFTELINNLAATGQSPLLKKLGIGLFDRNDDLDLLNVHKSSTRIISAALMHYHQLIASGWPRYLAQSYSTSIIVNQICYGSYRSMKLRDFTNYYLVNQLATSLSLYADKSSYNTSIIKESIL